MKITLVTASQKSKIEDTWLGQSIAQFDPKFALFHKVIFYGDNKQPLSLLYNQAIDSSRNDNADIIIFVHDDVYINCSDFIRRVIKYTQMYTVFGLAGTEKATIKEPALWHLMGGRENLRGCVAHGLYTTEYGYTSFGHLPARALLIDGVFIGVNLKTLPESIRFDENIPSKFHYYDLCFSLDCSLNKVVVGVGDIPIVHKSPGLSGVSAEWIAGQQYFLSKYKKYENKVLTV